MKIRNQTTIYLIRHGETPSNAAKIKQGIKINDYLDTKGILQTQEMAKMIQFLDLDVLFTSYLHRAEETAAYIEKTLLKKVPIFHDYRLRERDFGSLSGKTDDELAIMLPHRIEQENMQTYDYRPYGGENVDDVRKRVISALLDLVTNYDHHNIGVISHGGPIRLLLFHFPTIPRLYHALENAKKDVGNADIYEWEISDNTVRTLQSLLL